MKRELLFKIICVLVLGCFLSLPRAETMTLPYESCECNLRSYLEDFMRQWSKDKIKAQFCENCEQGSKQEGLGILAEERSQNSIPEACLWSVMVRAPQKGSSAKKSGYYSCRETNSGWRFTETISAGDMCQNRKGFSLANKNIYTRRPCLSESFVKGTKLALEGVGKCIDPLDNGGNIKPLLPLLASESELVVSRKSGTGAICMGQLTGVAIQSAAERLFSKDLKTKIKTKKECAMVRDAIKQSSFREFEKLPSKARDPEIRFWKNRCDFVKDPRFCLLYSFAFMRQNYEGVKKIFLESNKLFNSDEDKERVVHYISQWSYNVGNSLYLTYVKGFLTDVWKGGSSEKFISDFRNYVNQGLEKSNIGKSRKKEIMNYMLKVSGLKNDGVGSALGTAINMFIEANKNEIKDFGLTDCGF